METKNELSLTKLLIVIIVLLVIIIFLLLGWRITKLQFWGVELEPPATSTSVSIPMPTSAIFQNQTPTSNQFVSQPTLPTTKLLSLDILKQVLDETSGGRVEITLGRLREFCNQGIVTCDDHPSSNWSIMGPAIIGTDPLQQPITGAQVIKVNKDSTGSWLPNWPIGLFYVPAGQNAVIPTPGVAYLLEGSLPVEWIIR